MKIKLNGLRRSRDELLILDANFCEIALTLYFADPDLRVGGHNCLS